MKTVTGWLLVYLVCTTFKVRRPVYVPQLLHQPVRGLYTAAHCTLHVVPPLVGLQPLKNLEVLRSQVLVLTSLLTYSLNILEIVG